MSDWRKELNGILGGHSKATRAEQENTRFAEFVAAVVRPTLKELSEALAEHERKVSIRETPASATLTVRHGDTEEIAFRILTRSLPAGLMPYAEIRLHKGLRLVKTEGHFKTSGHACTIDQVQSADIIACFLNHYRAALDIGGR